MYRKGYYMSSFGKFLFHGREWAKHKYIKKTPEKGYTRYWYTETGPSDESNSDDLGEPGTEEFNEKFNKLSDDEKVKYLNDDLKKDVGLSYEELMMLSNKNSNEYTSEDYQIAYKFQAWLKKWEDYITTTETRTTYTTIRDSKTGESTKSKDVETKVTKGKYVDSASINKNNLSSNYKLQKSEDSDDNILTKKNKDGSQTTIYKDSNGNLRKNTYYSDHSKDTSEKLDSSSNEAQAANRLLNTKKKEKIKHSALLGEAFIQDYLGVEID